MISCIFKNERNLRIILQEYSKELLIIFLNSQIQQFPYEKQSLKSIENPPINEKSAEKVAEKVAEKSNEKSAEKPLEKLASLTMIEEKKDEELLEEGVYWNYMRYVRDSQMKGEKKGARSLSISSTNSSQNSCFISSSQHFCFPLRFPRQLWEDVIEFINNISESG